MFRVYEVRKTMEFLYSVGGDFENQSEAEKASSDARVSQEEQFRSMIGRNIVVGESYVVNIGRRFYAERGGLFAFQSKGTFEGGVDDGRFKLDLIFRAMGTAPNVLEVLESVRDKLKCNPEITHQDYNEGKTVLDWEKF